MKRIIFVYVFFLNKYYNGFLHVILFKFQVFCVIKIYINEKFFFNYYKIILDNSMPNG